MKRIPLAILAFFFLSFAGEDRVTRHFETHDFRGDYETRQGRFDGTYTSYYTNGQLRATGRFENNLRTGKWSVWDSTGRLRMQRVYTDPFTFKRLHPKVPKEKVITLLNVAPYTPAYNHQGIIAYYPLREQSVVWARRIWRWVTPPDNAVLFERNRLFSALNREIFARTLTPYQPTDDEFRCRIDPPTIDTANATVIGYKIKEDCLFDRERLVTETRIIGLCPVVVYTHRPDTADLYWVYFPESRLCLGREKISQPGFPEKVSTLDDLFFYRCFHSEIYKEANVYDRALATYAAGAALGAEAQRIEISLIEEEHGQWIRLTQ